MSARIVSVAGAAVLGVCTGLAVALGSLWWMGLALVVIGSTMGLWRHAQLPSGQQVAVLGLATVVPAAVVGGVMYADPDSGAINSALVAAVVSGGLLAFSAWRTAQWLAQVELARGWELARAVETERDSTITAALVSERSILAGEIHDRLGHRLSLTTVRLGRLWQDPGLTPYQRDSLMEMRDDLAGITDDIGTTVSLLEDGKPALSRGRDPQQVVKTARAAGQKITAELTALDDANDLARGALTRVLEEALTNAARHAPSSAVHANASRMNDSIVLIVTNPLSDNVGVLGTGARTGLRRMRERVTHLGGTLEHSHEQEFTLTARVPRIARLQPLHAAGA